MAAMLRPIDFRPALTDARLRVISERLLDVLYDVELELSSPSMMPSHAGQRPSAVSATR